MRSHGGAAPDIRARSTMTAMWTRLLVSSLALIRLRWVLTVAGAHEGGLSDLLIRQPFGHLGRQAATASVVTGNARIRSTTARSPPKSSLVISAATVWQLHAGAAGDERPEQHREDHDADAAGGRGGGRKHEEDRTEADHRRESDDDPSGRGPQGADRNMSCAMVSLSTK